MVRILNVNEIGGRKTKTAGVAGGLLGFALDYSACAYASPATDRGENQKVAK
jgi:hypothetical protein